MGAPLLEGGVQDDWGGSAEGITKLGAAGAEGEEGEGVACMRRVTKGAEEVVDVPWGGSRRWK